MPVKLELIKDLEVVQVEPLRNNLTIEFNFCDSRIEEQNNAGTAACCGVLRGLLYSHSVALLHCCA